MLVHLDERTYLIEFKYFIVRRTGLLEDDGTGPSKGGAGEQNKREFWQCVEKLRACPHNPVHSVILILVYQRFQPARNQKTFEQSFEALADERITEEPSLECEPLICKLLEIRRDAGPLSGTTPAPVPPQ